jgi:hypothetical protein
MVLFVLNNQTGGKFEEKINYLSCWREGKQSDRKSPRFVARCLIQPTRARRENSQFMAKKGIVRPAFSENNWGTLRAKRRTKLYMTKRKTTAAGLSKIGGRNGKPSTALPIGRLLRHSLPRVFLAGLLFLCGCQTSKQSLFTAAGPGWHVQQGQALWRPQRGSPEFGGDLVLASDEAGRCLIQFDKTPMTILFAQTTSTRWLIRFPQRQMGFTGHGPGPARFSWLYLPAALAGKPLPERLHFENKADGGWRLENSRTGETVEGFLSP